MIFNETNYIPFDTIEEDPLESYLSPVTPSVRRHLWESNCAPGCGKFLSAPNVESQKGSGLPFHPILSAIREEAEEVEEDEHPKNRRQVASRTE